MADWALVDAAGAWQGPALRAGKRPARGHRRAPRPAARAIATAAGPAARSSSAARSSARMPTGQYTCRIYDKRFAQCRLFPLHAARTCRAGRGVQLHLRRPSRPGWRRGPQPSIAVRSPGERHAEHRDRRRPVGRRRQGQDRRPPDREGPGGGALQRRPQRRPHRDPVDGEKFVLHLIPSGILHPGILCVMGNGMVIDPWALEKEIGELRGAGDRGRRQPRDLRPRAPHPAAPPRARGAGRGAAGRAQDRHHPPRHRPRLRGQGRPARPDAWATCCGPTALPGEAARRRAGTTSRSAAARVARRRSTGTLSSRDLAGFGERLRPRITDASLVLHRQMARAATRSSSRARRPRCSTSTTAPTRSSRRRRPWRAGAATGLGIPPTRIDGVLGIAKAYTTRVGAGPLAHRDRRARSRTRSASAATSTAPPPGRPRRCGWFDAVVVRYSRRASTASTPSPSPSSTCSTRWPRSRSAPPTARGRDADASFPADSPCSRPASPSTRPCPAGGSPPAACGSSPPCPRRPGVRRAAVRAGGAARSASSPLAPTATTRSSAAAAPSRPGSTDGPVPSRRGC